MKIVKIIGEVLWLLGVSLAILYYLAEAPLEAFRFIYQEI